MDESKEKSEKVEQNESVRKLGKNGESVLQIPVPTKAGFIYMVLAFVAGLCIGSFFSMRKVQDFEKFVSTIYEKQAKHIAERIIDDAKREAEKIKGGAK